MHTAVYRASRTYRSECTGLAVWGIRHRVRLIPAAVVGERQGSFVSATNVSLLVHRNDLRRQPSA